MMKCTVLLFAQLADATGVRRLDLSLHEGATAADAATEVFDRYPAAASWRDRTALAVDERYVPPEAPLHDGCTVAMIPPVSGG